MPHAPTPLDRDDVVPVVEPDGGRPGENPQVTVGGELAGRAGVDEERPSGAGGGSSDARGAPADDEQVAVLVEGVVARRFGRRDEPSLAGQRPRAQPVLELDQRRPLHRPLTDLDERVRLLLAGRVDAARPVEVDAAEAAENAVSDERGRQRLTRAPLVLDAGEA